MKKQYKTRSALVEPQRKTCSVLSESQRRRTKVAIVTIVVLSLGLLFLGFWSAHEHTVEEVSVRDYLSDTAAQPQYDPLSLLDSGFELTGISQDGRVIGYATDVSVGEAAVRMKDVLQSQGWVLASDTNQGILTFEGQGDKVGGSIGCLVQFSSLGEGCAIVAQMW